MWCSKCHHLLQTTRESRELRADFVKIKRAINSVEPHTKHILDQTVGIRWEQTERNVSHGLTKTLRAEWTWLILGRFLKSDISENAISTRFCSKHRKPIEPYFRNVCKGNVSETMNVYLTPLSD